MSILIDDFCIRLLFYFTIKSDTKTFSYIKFGIEHKLPNYKFFTTAATNRIKPHSIELESCHFRRGLKHSSSIVPRFFSMLAPWRRISPFSHVKQNFSAFSFGFAPRRWRWRDFDRVSMHGENHYAKKFKRAMKIF